MLLRGKHPVCLDRLRARRGRGGATVALPTRPRPRAGGCAPETRTIAGRLVRSALRMRRPPHDDELDLELPALDGDEGPTDLSFGHDVLDEIASDGGDAFDDATGEDAPFDDIAIDGAETGWLDGAEGAGDLDVGTFPLATGDEGKILEDDEADLRHDLDDLFSDDESFAVDGGEEGPVGDDGELLDDDLPALDADDDGELPDEALFDNTLVGYADELNWEDRAWARVSDVVEPSLAEEVEDSGVFATQGEDPSQRARDAAWRALDETGRVMAAGLLPGGNIVVAMASFDRSRAWLVRVRGDGEARIIAEVDPRSSSGDEDEEACVVTFVRWDAARGWLFVGGSFGVEAYRPS